MILMYCGNILRRWQHRFPNKSKDAQKFWKFYESVEEFQLVTTLWSGSPKNLKISWEFENFLQNIRSFPKNLKIVWKKLLYSKIWWNVVMSRLFSNNLDISKMVENWKFSQNFQFFLNILRIYKKLSKITQNIGSFFKTVLNNSKICGNFEDLRRFQRIC